MVDLVGIVQYTWLPQKTLNQISRLCKSFLGHFPGLFKVFLQDLKFSFHYHSFMHQVFCTCD